MTGNMDMEKLAIVIIHPIVGTTADKTGLVNIERNFIEDKSVWGSRSVEGMRIVKNYKDPNCNLVITALKGSDLDFALSRMLLYPKSNGNVTWMDERIEGQILGGTGDLRSILQTNVSSVDDNATYTLMVANYTGN